MVPEGEAEMNKKQEEQGAWDRLALVPLFIPVAINLLALIVAGILLTAALGIRWVITGKEPFPDDLPKKTDES